MKREMDPFCRIGWLLCIIGLLFNRTIAVMPDAVALPLNLAAIACIIYGALRMRKAA